MECSATELKIALFIKIHEKNEEGKLKVVTASAAFDVLPLDEPLLPPLLPTLILDLVCLDWDLPAASKLLRDLLSGICCKFALLE